MKAAQILRGKIQGDSLTLGAMATFHFWPGLVELAMRAGLDYLIIDLEHFTHSHERVAEACAIGRRMDFPVLIRPPEAEMTPLRLAMDLGPCGLLVPCVESKATMDLVRDAIYMKPRGKRRPGGPGNFWVSDYNYASWKANVEDDFIVLPQIERKTGLRNVQAIAEHPITTAMAVGPYDLSADLGCCWQADHPDLLDALKHIRAAARAVGKNTWMIGDAEQLKALGFTFLCVAETTMLLESTLKGTAAGARAGTATPVSAADLPLP